MTIPTKEQALAALDELFPTGDIAEKHIKTLRTYIESEKDSLGADEQETIIKEISEETGIKVPEVNLHQPYTRPIIDWWWLTHRIKTQKRELARLNKNLSAPSSAHVQGIEKVREMLNAALKHTPDDCPDTVAIPINEALAILDQQARGLKDE